jgi:hypothetical protein
MQAVCHDFDQQLENFYSRARRVAFSSLSTSAGVVTRNIQGIKDALDATTRALQGARATVAAVVETVSATAQHFRSNSQVRTDVLSGLAPTDPALRVVHVSATTLQHLQVWFSDKTVPEETSLSINLARATTQSEFEDWNTQARTFGTASEQYRLTLKHVGNALYPFTRLVDDTIGLGNPAPFAAYVDGAKARIEGTAVRLVENLPHADALKQLEELAALNKRFCEQASARLRQGGAITPAEEARAYQILDGKLAEIENPANLF